MGEILVPFVNCLVVMDAEGDRLFAKYYDNRSKVEQKKLEVALHKKSKSLAPKSESDILMIDNELIAFKSGIDCKFFVGGSIHENDLILVGVLEGVYDSVSSLIRGSVDSKTLLDNLELILLAMDEVIDNGNIMEMDYNAVINRVQMRSNNEPVPAQQQQAASFGDMTIAQALGLARDQFFKSMSSSRSDGF